MHTIDNPAITAVTCTPDYLRELVNPTLDSLDALDASYNNYVSDATKGKMLIRSTTHAAYMLALYLIHAKSTSNTATDIVLGDSKFFLMKFSIKLK